MNTFQRWLKYGPNVLVQVMAVLVIAIIVNWAAEKTPGRWDMTASGQYSLSKQTVKVLGNLQEEYTIVSLLSSGDERIKQANDLINEYQRHSSKVKVELINPSREIGRLEKFYDRLRARTKEQVQPTIKAIDDGRGAIKEVSADIRRQLEPLKNLVGLTQNTDLELKQWLRPLAQAFGRAEQDFKDQDEAVGKALENTLPDYGDLSTKLKANLQHLESGIYGESIARFEVAIKAEDTPAAVKEALLKMVEDFKHTREKLATAIKGFEQAPTPEEYNKIRNQLGDSTSPQIVVLENKRGMQVVSLADMFRAPTAEEADRLEKGKTPELGFVGEEKITGTLVSMELKHPPLVVFIHGKQPALGMGGQYEEVGQRLKNMGLDVKQWSPSGQQNPQTGQPMPPMPPPEPKAEQNVVWIVLPPEPPNPQMMFGAGPTTQETAEFVRGRLEMGDAALVMLGPSMTARFGQPEPLATLTEPFGVNVQIDRVVLRERRSPDGKTQPDSNLIIEQWADGMPVSKALAGLQGVFVMASPIEIKAGEHKDLKIEKLVEVTGQGLWAETDFGGRNAKRKPETSAERFTIGVAIEKGDEKAKEKQRVIVVSDPAWATDQLVNYGMFGPNTAKIGGAMFPANAELFVNSVNWLTKLDQLIAATARSQDIRRIADIKPQQFVMLYWGLFLGLPVVIIAMGVVVWQMRTRA